MTYAKEQLNAMSDGQLRDLLNAEFESQGADAALIEAVTDILVARNADPGEAVNAAAAYKTFCEEYAETEPLYDEVLEEIDPSPTRTSGKRGTRPRLAKIFTIVAVAAALLLGSTVAASAAGVDLWGAVARWSADTFGIESARSTDVVDLEKSRDSCALLREALEYHNVDVPVVPYYLPEGYEVEAIDSAETFEGTAITSVFDGGNGRILISYLITGDTPAAKYYAVDDVEPEVYTFAGVDHYITINEGEYRAFWINGNIICTISGVADNTSLKAIIDSIYGEQ